MSLKSLNNIFKGDKVIWMVFFLLCMISIVEVYSASSTLSYKGGNYWAPLLKHGGMLFIGFIVMIVVMNIKCRYFKIATLPALVLSVLMLIGVLLTGGVTNGASRWIEVMGIQFQPSELGKGALVLAVAQILSAMQTEAGAAKKAFKYILFLSAAIIIPISFENLSTALLASLTVLLMMFVGRVPLKQIGKLLGVGALTVVFALALVMAVGTDEEKNAPKQTLTEQTTLVEEETEENFVGKLFHRADTWKARINRFLNNEYVAPKDYDLDKDGQIGHANIAIASSNILGKGPGNSNERDFLSQAFSDFIYAIIIEEMGIIGAFFVAFLYIVILMRSGQIAGRCENSFPAFLAMGIAFLLVTQALFNMAVAVGLAPVTGQPLPLISKGGTSTIINCLYIGMLLSISRFAKKRDNDTATVRKAVGA
ncbi:FtsW/RodA/SpoVE family cell cycle protein [Prevotella intermedia]|mgnify:FL=1|uniref:Probable peptidoglycan glycosyltransferase FtsW n=1 Tax=Prevotella intermedia TaxID=28131 RepID=A0A1P8JI19_PREIN|nr:FtsW/RodA/SpoVE family cell cycle protein [Prevotella intermedia]AFJ09720.1 cell cycle protein, FtsW/RodA/SpoVE family [Prevotella intermedia 17]APW33397.1 rod shape-determining protein RodA [Prevotella intermedia]PDP81754.1 rod shape-determining protein RodA [Prevotella intermedia]BAR95166.1 cell division protein FtsW [Prevotella intermedia]